MRKLNSSARYLFLLIPMVFIQPANVHTEELPKIKVEVKAQSDFIDSLNELNELLDNTQDSVTKKNREK